MFIEDNGGFALTSMDFIIAAAVVAVVAILAWQISGLLHRRGVKPRHVTLLDEKLTRLEDSLRGKRQDEQKP